MNRTPSNAAKVVILIFFAVCLSSCSSTHGEKSMMRRGIESCADNSYGLIGTFLQGALETPRYQNRVRSTKAPIDARVVDTY